MASIPAADGKTEHLMLADGPVLEIKQKGDSQNTSTLGYRTYQYGKHWYELLELRKPGKPIIQYYSKQSLDESWLPKAQKRADGVIPANIKPGWGDAAFPELNRFAAQTILERNVDYTQRFEIDFANALRAMHQVPECPPSASRPTATIIPFLQKPQKEATTIPPGTSESSPAQADPTLCQQAI